MNMIFKYIITFFKEYFKMSLIFLLFIFYLLVNVDFNHCAVTWLPNYTNYFGEICYIQIFPKGAPKCKLDAEVFVWFQMPAQQSIKVEILKNISNLIFEDQPKRYIYCHQYGMVPVEWRKGHIFFDKQKVEFNIIFIIQEGVRYTLQKEHKIGGVLDITTNFRCVDKIQYLSFVFSDLISSLDDLDSEFKYRLMTNSLSGGISSWFCLVEPGRDTKGGYLFRMTLGEHYSNAWFYNSLSTQQKKQFSDVPFSGLNTINLGFGSINNPFSGKDINNPFSDKDIIKKLPIK